MLIRLVYCTSLTTAKLAHLTIRLCDLNSRRWLWEQSIADSMELTMFSRRMMITLMIFCLALVAFALMPGERQAQAQTFSTWNGTYNTATKAGIITYTPTRIFPRIGSGGWVRVDGVRYWGVVASSRGITGMTWYYGTDSTGPEAGRAILTLQPEGSYVGPIQFTNRRGVITGQGTVVFVLP